MEYDSRAHNNTQTEINEDELSNCNQMQNVEHNTTSQAGYSKRGTHYGFFNHRLLLVGFGHAGGGTVAPYAADLR
jgi:hypothetical protein